MNNVHFLVLHASPMFASTKQIVFNVIILNPRSLPAVSISKNAFELQIYSYELLKIN